MTEIPWALDAIKALGVAGGPVFAVLWWLERRERVACQSETRALLIQVLTVASQATASVMEVTKAVTVVDDRTKDMESAVAQSNQLVRSLGAEIKRART